MLKKLPFVFAFMLLAFVASAQQIKLTLPMGHTNTINDIDITNDGRWLVTASDDYTAKVWDLQSGKLLHTLIRHTFYVNTARFSPDGKNIITASADGYFMIWETATGQPLYEGINNPDVMEEMLGAWYSTSGETFYTISSSGERKGCRLLEWSATDIEPVDVHLLKNRQLGIFTVNTTQSTLGFSLWDSSEVWVKQRHDFTTRYMGRHTDWLTDMKISNDGRYMATASRDSTIKIWSIENLELLHDIKTGNQVSSVCFSPDGTHLLADVAYSPARIWDVATGQHLFRFNTPRANSENVQAIAYSPDGSIAVINTWDDSVEIWNAATGTLINRVNAGEEVGEIIKFTPNGHYFVTGGNDGSLLVWDARAAKKLHSFPHEAEELQAVLLTADEKSIVAGTTRGVSVWNTATGILTNKFMYDYKGGEPAFTPDRKKAAITMGFSKMVVYDIENNKILYVVDSLLLTGTMRWKQLSPDGKKLLVEHHDSLQQIDLETLTVQNSFAAHTTGFSAAAYSAGGKYISVITSDSLVVIYNATTGAKVCQLAGNQIYTTVFSTDEKYMLVNEGFHWAVLWNIETGKVVKRFEARPAPGEASEAFSPTGDCIAYTGRNKKMRSVVKIRNTKKGKHIKTLDDTEGVWELAFSTDGRYLVTAQPDEFLKIWDTRKWKEQARIEILYNHVNHLLSVGNRHVAVTALDGSTRMYDIATGKEVINFVSFSDSVNYISLLPDGYYHCTPGAAKKLYYTSGLNTLGFDQLDIKYNRPDKVREALGIAHNAIDTAMVSAYRQAFEKRVKKLGIDTSAFGQNFSVPQSGFINPPEYEQQQPAIKLHIYGADSTYTLNRVNIWVNECPLWGERGLNLSGRNLHRFDTIVELPLCAGENKIETSVLTQNGIESYRLPVYVKYNAPQTIKGKTYFIGIGIDNFSEPGHRLDWSVKDIRDLTTALRAKLGNELIIVDTLYNQRVTVENIKALKKQLLTTTVNDKVIISYSGHGVLNEQRDYFLSTYPIAFKQPENGGLPYAELENLLDSIPARRKLMLIDACHSGEIDKEGVVARAGSADTTSGAKTGGLELLAEVLEENRLGLKNSFELMQEIFVNVSKGTGTTVISAAGGNQFAYEQGKLKNGVFTYCVLEMLSRNQPCTVQQLQQWVAAEVLRITAGKQRPTSRTETSGVDWVVW